MADYLCDFARSLEQHGRIILKNKGLNWFAPSSVQFAVHDHIIFYLTPISPVNKVSSKEANKHTFGLGNLILNVYLPTSLYYLNETEHCGVVVNTAAS
jgi:hypothetical protein